MQDEREKATELLKSGEYYSEALKWYNSRYITPKSQLTAMSVFAILAIFCFFVSIVATVGIFPLSDEQSFFVNRPLEFDEGIVINEIGDKTQDPSISYLKYMLSNYVSSREEYNPANIERNFNFVIELSSDAIFLDYLTIADQNQNPNHPVWQYGSQAIREIFISRASIVDLQPQLENYNKDTEYTAKVTFVSSLLFVDNLQTQEKHEADIKFTFNPIILDQESGEIKQLPNMVVTDYKTRKL